MWSAACGQAAKDPDFFVYRAVDVRRRWSWACLLVLFCRCVAPDHALCLDSVLSAYSLQASCVVVASGGPLWRRRAGVRSENSRRASGALAASRDVFVSLAKFRALRRLCGLVAALVCVQSPRGDGSEEGVVLGTDPRRQCFGLEHLR